MGVIEIRNRSERLGNVGSVRMADVRTGAAEAYAQEAQAIGADAERKRNLASGLGDLGRGLMALGLTLRDKEDQAKVDAYVSRYQSEMNAFNNGYVGENGERVKGAMEAMPATEDETVEWERGCYSHRNHVGSSLRKELKLNDRQMQMADKRLVGYNLTLQSNWATRSGTLNRQRELAGAQTRERESCRALEMLPSEAVNSDAAITTWMEWRDAGERMLQVQGIDPGSGQADEYRRARALSVLKTRFEKRLRNEEAACEGLSPDEAKARMGQFRAALKDGDPIQLLVPDSTAVRGDDGQTIADFVRAALGPDADARMDAFRSAAVRDAKAAERRVRRSAEVDADTARKEHENAYWNEIAETRMAVLDPDTVEKTTLSVTDYRRKLEEDASLDPQTRERMLSQYAAVASYQERYVADRKLHEERVRREQDKVKAAILKDRSEHGFFTETTDANGKKRLVFNPATAFPKDTDPYAYERFSLDSPVWNDVNQARNELEAAKVTGTVSRAFYESRLAHLRTMQDETTRAAWLKVYPSVKDLVRSGYGSEDPGKAEKAFRKKVGAPEAIWAKKRGAYGSDSPVDWIQDSLEHAGKEAGSEEAIPPDVMVKMEETVQRLARNGVDPTDAIRQLVAPTIQAGIVRDIRERVQDEDYFRTLVDRASISSQMFESAQKATARFLTNRGKGERIQDAAGSDDGGGSDGPPSQDREDEREEGDEGYDD